MKTLLSAAAMTAVVVSGVALADGVGMKGDRSSGYGMSERQSFLQSSGAQHMGRDMRAGKGREHSSARLDRNDDDRGEPHRREGRHDRDYDDDKHRGPHMKNMDWDRS